MKKSMVTAAILSSLLFAPSVFADNTEEGTLTINGEVLPTTCMFLDGNSSATITMAPIGKSQFDGMSAGQSYVGYSNNADQVLKLKCESGKTPHISFITTDFDSAYPNITKATGTAAGVGFTLKVNEVAVTPRDGVALASNGTGEYDLNFSAQYALTTAPASVGAGTLSSTVVMRVNSD